MMKMILLDMITYNSKLFQNNHIDKIIRLGYNPEKLPEVCCTQHVSSGGVHGLDDTPDDIFMSLDKLGVDVIHRKGSYIKSPLSHILMKLRINHA